MRCLDAPAYKLARVSTGVRAVQERRQVPLLSDAEYQAERDTTRATLGDLPDGDRIRAVDAYRARVLALPDAIEAASPARREELSRIVVQRVVVRDRRLEAIEWTPAARLFFERQQEYPQGALGTRVLSVDDSLAWYVA